VSTKPGDIIEFTSTSRNIGDAPGGDIIIEQKLPPGLSYVPETVRMYVGADTSLNGNKTDKPGDDQVEWDPLTGTLRIRIGKGATATKGGTIDPTDPPVVVKYQVRIDDRACRGAAAAEHHHGDHSGRRSQLWADLLSIWKWSNSQRADDCGGSAVRDQRRL
jgi:uncharacterized repeat protein (TIGR01451 family)